MPMTLHTFYDVKSFWTIELIFRIPVRINVCIGSFKDFKLILYNHPLNWSLVVLNSQKMGEPNDLKVRRMFFELKKIIFEIMSRHAHLWRFRNAHFGKRNSMGITPWDGDRGRLVRKRLYYHRQRSTLS